jgi:hypothetical protein
MIWYQKTRSKYLYLFLHVLFINVAELEEKKEDKPEPTLGRSNSQRQKRPSLVDRLGLGILKSSHNATPDIPEQSQAQANQEEQPASTNPRQQKKRTFSMKLKSFVHGKTVQENEGESSSNVPRTQHPVQGEQPNQEDNQQPNQPLEQNKENQSTQPTH